MEKMKFRAWDNIGKCMLDWNTICQTAFNRDDKNGYGLMYRILTNQAAGNDNYGFCVMLWTGLQDKNKNDVYNGDIILKDEYYWVVRFDADRDNHGHAWVAYAYNHKKKRGDSYNTFFVDKSILAGEVVGNIYQNPELIRLTQPA